MNMESSWGLDHHGLIVSTMKYIDTIYLTPLNSHPMIAPR